MSWSYDDGSRFERSWNADFEASGDLVTATPLAWDQTIEAGQKISFALSGIKG